MPMTTPDHPDRVLPLQGATNFRDLGGYPGHEGRPLRWRRVFRSDHLGQLTAADRERLAPLKLARSFDFRGVDERAATPYDVPGLRQHALSIEPSVSQRMGDLAASGEALTAAHMAELMEDLYRRLVTDDAVRFAEFFGHLLDDDAPLVFHCTAGKDRTGVAAALLLLALGVPQTQVEQDYLLTNTVYRRPHTPDSVLPPEAQAVMWGVQPSFLQAALEAVHRYPGGLEAYLERRMGLDGAARDRLRAQYLQG